MNANIGVASLIELELADAPGIAPGSPALQASADLSQLNVRAENWRGRTDSNRHRLRRQRSAYAFLPRPQIELGGSVGFEPTTASFTVRSSARLSYEPHEIEGDRS